MPGEILTAADLAALTTDANRHIKMKAILFAFGGAGPTHMAGLRGDVPKAVVFPAAPVFPQAPCSRRSSGARPII